MEYVRTQELKNTTECKLNTIKSNFQSMYFKFVVEFLLSTFLPVISSKIQADDVQVKSAQISPPTFFFFSSSTLSIIISEICNEIL